MRTTSPDRATAAAALGTASDLPGPTSSTRPGRSHEAWIDASAARAVGAPQAASQQRIAAAMMRRQTRARTLVGFRERRKRIESRFAPVLSDAAV
jgi:hypothetical protein